jgi:predicted O-linked N-acetylglucosamine transferase (SPINDLY family)
MDYLVADHTLIPASERQHYSEKIIYLPGYHVNASLRRITERTFTREELGLPPQGFIFACCNSNYKIMPNTFAAWMRILKRVNGSVLFVYAENQVAQRNLTREANRLGVEARQIVFGERVGLAEYLARFRTMDLFLDTLPYNAGTTASDALWAGLPVLTCCGQTFAGRIASSLLTTIDLPELIVATMAEYEELAVRLAANSGQLEQIKQKLSQNRLNAPLFNPALFTKHLESAFTQIFERHHAGLFPDRIYVRP